jgi:hypothetical protein
MKTGVAYFETRNPRHVLYDIKDMVAKNCNFVVHTYSEYDLNFNSLVMREIVRLSQEEGLEAYINPWGLGRVFGGPEPYSHYVAEHPDQCQRTADGRHAPIICMNSGPFREYMKFWIDSAAQTGAEVVFWDEPHFYFSLDAMTGKGKANEWACACDRCKILFRERFKREMPEMMDEDVIRFRDETIVDMLGEFTDYVKERGMKNAICVLPEEDPITGVSNWELLAELKSVDIFGTDPYWMIFNKPLEEYVRGATRRVMEICREKKKEAQMWVQAFMILEGREEEVGRAVRIMAEEGCENIAAWAYNGFAFMNHKCQDHEKVWKILGEAFGEVRGK